MQQVTIHFTIRRFLQDEIADYKAMRLEALWEEPGMFGNSHAFEAAFSEEQWMARLNNPDSVCFGLYADGLLIGITSIIRDKEIPEEAYLTQSYIRKAYRGMGLSKLLYDARLAWARGKELRRLIIGHRESNIASKAANQHYGFRYTHRQSRTWPDGKTEDMLYYVLEI